MITYRPEFNLYWPDYDDLGERTHAAVLKRLHHSQAVLRHTSGRQCVVQAGGHVGLWPMRLSAAFATVHTFEPDEACYRAMVANLAGPDGPSRRVFPRCAALRAETGAGFMIPGKCSSWRYTESPVDAAVSAGPAVAATTIDSLNLGVCDAIILDVEGSEIEALRGAVATITRCRPVIQLEEWYDNRADYLDYMRSIGYEPRACAGADTIYVHRS